GALTDPSLTPPLSGPAPPWPHHQEELATRPRVPALLRRIAPYSALSPERDTPPPRPLGTLVGVASPALQSLLGLLLLLRLPWLVGSGGIANAGAIGGLLGACV
ncbi:S12A7 protein, partial [Sakesphorus luctuosus]|nr:S12A7 protein [Sakesphorus luctuosus]